MVFVNHEPSFLAELVAEHVYQSGLTRSCVLPGNLAFITRIYFCVMLSELYGMETLPVDENAHIKGSPHGHINAVNSCLHSWDASNAGKSQSPRCHILRHHQSSGIVSSGVQSQLISLMEQ